MVDTIRAQGEVTKSGAAGIKGCLTHQGVVVLNLFHCRLRGQRKLDDLETVKLLWRRRTARQQMHVQNEILSALRLHYRSILGWHIRGTCAFGAPPLSKTALLLLT